MFRGTNGKYLCTKKYSECVKYLEDLAKRTRASWIGDDERKKATKKSFVERLHNPETVQRSREAKLKKFGTFDPVKAKEFRRYARFIRQRAQKWAKAQGYVIGRNTYHVDHKLSILDAWNAGLTEEIVNHPANLQIIESTINIAKAYKSSITVEELLELVKNN